MSQSFFRACLLFLGGILLLFLAVHLLAHVWGWLALIALIALTGWVIHRVVKARQDRW